MQKTKENSEKQRKTEKYKKMAKIQRNSVKQRKLEDTSKKHQKTGGDRKIGGNAKKQIKLAKNREK